MRTADRDSLARLAAWRPRLGVLSVYVSVDPADRSEGWRLALGEALRRVVAAGGSNEERRALMATADRARVHFPEGFHTKGRSQIGFLEIGLEGDDGRWFSIQMPGPTRVIRAERAYLRPLIELLEEGSVVGVVAVSAGRVRVLEWGLGFSEDLDDWDLGVRRGGWHEQKSPGTRDPRRGTAVSSSGHDRHDRRLEANRERFLHQAGQRAARLAGQRRWRHLLAFGDRHHVDALCRAIPDDVRLVRCDEANLVNEDRSRIATRVRAVVGRLNREHESELVETARAAALSAEGRGALGPEPTRMALSEARVAHLLIDAEWERLPAERRSRGRLDAGLAEALIAGALETGAQVTPVEGEGADALAEHGGVAAILRY